MKWAVGHPEKIVDWGTRSINAITVPAKRIVAHLRGRDATRAYYYGCSTGGHQAYAEVQKYPQDFDGVIAGAPGNKRVALNAEFLWRFLANREQGTTDDRHRSELAHLLGHDRAGPRRVLAALGLEQPVVELVGLRFRQRHGDRAEEHRSDGRSQQS
jgi:hypothetical protein